MVVLSKHVNAFSRFLSVSTIQSSQSPDCSMTIDIGMVLLDPILIRAWLPIHKSRPESSPIHLTLQRCPGSELLVLVSFVLAVFVPTFSELLQASPLGATLIVQSLIAK